MTELESLRNLVLAPYILKATALIGVRRQVGGNQFRHCFSTLGILLDYKFFTNSLLLKASLLHDLLEDVPETQVDDIRWMDGEGEAVVHLVLEVTRRKDETKVQYLQRVLDKGSENALLLKCADRISNLTDLHRDIQTPEHITKYLDQTEKYIIPMARKVNDDMVIELTDMVSKRRRILQMMKRENATGENEG